MLMDLLAVVLAIAILTAGAEFFVRGASLLALRLGVSPLFVGLTVVGFGTSSPELGASLSATLAGNPGISVGNVIGSNIFNIGFILGITALIRPIAVSFPAVRRDLFIALAIGVLPLLAYVAWGAVPRWLGVGSLAGLFLYLTLAYRADRAATQDTQEAAQMELTDANLAPSAPEALTGWQTALQLLMGLAGLLMLVGGSKLFVHAATAIAERWGISELIIGLTIVAVGTSLPELVTSMVAAWRKSADVAVGNIIGSNIFNVLGILGTCALVAPQPITAHAGLIGIPVMLLFSAALIPFVRSGGVLSRREGAVFLVGFVAYSIALAVVAQGDG